MHSNYKNPVRVTVTYYKNIIGKWNKKIRFYLRPRFLEAGRTAWHLPCCLPVSFFPVFVQGHDVNRSPIGPPTQTSHADSLLEGSSNCNCPSILLQTYNREMYAVCLPQQVYITNSLCLFLIQSKKNGMEQFEVVMNNGVWNIKQA